jgi:hypothetical protein
MNAREIDAGRGEGGIAVVNAAAARDCPGDERGERDEATESRD